MNRRLFLLFCAALSAPARAQPETADYGGPFILVDHRGGAVLDEAFRGKYMLIAFGYTHCPDVCPTLLTDMADVLAKLGPEDAVLAPIFITLDPARDTPAVLADYVSSFSTRLIGLTGPEEMIADVARRYRIKVRKQPEAGESYSVDHTAAIFLMGRDGRFLERFNSAVKPAEMAERIRARLRADQ